MSEEMEEKMMVLVKERRRELYDKIVSPLAHVSDLGKFQFPPVMPNNKKLIEQMFTAWVQHKENQQFIVEANAATTEMKKEQAALTTTQTELKGILDAAQKQMDAAQKQMAETDARLKNLDARLLLHVNGAAASHQQLLSSHTRVVNEIMFGLGDKFCDMVKPSTTVRQNSKSQSTKRDGDNISREPLKKSNTRSVTQATESSKGNSAVRRSILVDVDHPGTSAGQTSSSSSTQNPAPSPDTTTTLHPTPSPVPSAAVAELPSRSPADERRMAQACKTFVVNNQGFLHRSDRPPHAAELTPQANTDLQFVEQIFTSRQLTKVRIEVQNEGESFKINFDDTSFCNVSWSTENGKRVRYKCDGFHGRAVGNAEVVFTKLSNFKRHITRGLREHSCPCCEFVAGTSYDLDDHQKRHGH